MSGLPNGLAYRVIFAADYEEYGTPLVWSEDDGSFQLTAPVSGTWSEVVIVLRPDGTWAAYATIKPSDASIERGVI